MRQLSQHLTERSTGTLTSTTEQNPRECKNITVRSSKTLNPPILKIINSTIFLQDEEKELRIPKEEENKEVPPPETVYLPWTLHKKKIPFLDRLNISKDKDNFYNFVNILKQVHLELPFLDIIYIPKYAKFLNDIIGNQ